MKRFLLICFMFFLAGVAHGQIGPTALACAAGNCSGVGPPVGRVGLGAVFVYTDTASGKQYRAYNGGWDVLASSGTGTTITQAGSITIGSGGTGSAAFPTAFSASPICVAMNTTLTTRVFTAISSTTTITVNGTAGDVINYVCTALASLSPAAVPVATPGGGTYSTAQSITIASSTSGAVIHYTLDGSTPTCSSATYSSALTISSTTTLQAVACATGYATSPVLSATYTISSSATYPQTQPASAMSKGTNANMNGFLPYCPSPTNCSNIYMDLSSLPVDSDNNTALHTNSYNYDTAALNLDFGSASTSLEYHVVQPSTDTNVTFTPTQSIYSYNNSGAYDSETMDTLFPFNLNYSVEGGGSYATCATQSGDAHLTVVDYDAVKVYESYIGSGETGGLCAGTIRNDSTTIWDLTKPIEGQLTRGHTSSDAAGLPTFGLSIRYEDIAGGIKHAMRVTFPHSSTAFYQGDAYALVSTPAVHTGGNVGGARTTYMGERLRLKASKDISVCPGAQAQAILTAAKKYGFIIADIGNTFEVQGVYNSNWDSSQFSCLYSNIHVSDLEVVTPNIVLGVDLNPETPTGGASIVYDQTGKLNSSAGPGTLIPNNPVPPVITSFTASATSVPIGSSVTLSAAASNAVNLNTNCGAMTNGSATFTPQGNITCVLTAYNMNGYDVSGRTSGTPNPPSIAITVTGTPAATPVISPAAGSYSSAQTVSITDATSGASIFYTNDGSTPTKYSTPYSVPFTVASNQTIQAVATKTGLLNSAVASSAFSIVGATPATVGSAYTTTYDYSPRSVPVSFTAGNAAVIALMTDATTTPTTVTCGTKTATRIVNVAPIESATRQITLLFIPSVDGGSQTCTATNSASDGLLMSVQQVSGTSGVDVYSSGTGSGTPSSTLNCGSFTTTGTNRLGLAFGGQIYANASAPSGYTLMFASTGYGAAFVGIPTAGATSLTINNTYTDSAGCVALALKP